MFSCLVGIISPMSKASHMKSLYITIPAMQDGVYMQYVILFQYNGMTVMIVVHP